MTDLYIYPPIRAHIGTKHRACIRFFLYLHCCGDCNPLPGGTIEKGIRCKTGTVPAAVSLIQFSAISSHCRHDGKALRMDKSEDLP